EDSDLASEASYQYAAPFYYQILADDRIGLLQYGVDGVMNDFPYEEYPRFFPEASSRLVEIPDEAQNILKLLNTGEEDWERIPIVYHNLNIPRHQVGGEPYLVQQDTNYRMRCPLCGEIMPFPASVGDYCLDPRGFTGNQYVQVLFHYCKACHVVG